MASHNCNSQFWVSRKSHYLCFLFRMVPCWVQRQLHSRPASPMLSQGACSLATAGMMALSNTGTLVETAYICGLHCAQSSPAQHLVKYCYVWSPVKNHLCFQLRMVPLDKHEAASTWMYCSACSCSSTNLLQFPLSRIAAPPASILVVSFLRALTKMASQRISILGNTQARPT